MAIRLVSVLVAVLLAAPTVRPAAAQRIPAAPLIGAPTQIAEEVGRLLGLAEACFVPKVRIDEVMRSTSDLLETRGVPPGDSLRLMRLGSGRGDIERGTRPPPCDQVRRAFSTLEGDLARQLR